MKRTKLLLAPLLLLALTQSWAQDKKLLTLKEAIEIALSNSEAAALAKTKVTSSQLELETIKNNQYPSLKASGQYLRLSSAHVDSNIQSNSSSGSGSNTAPLKIDQLVLGQVNATMPVFNGFKLKNSIEASRNMYEAETFSEKHSKEEIGLEVVSLFSALYKAEQLTDLIADNLKTAEQRVKDFKAMEENGLIARNDLLKAQLQQSNIQLSLDNAKKNVAVANYRLTTLLKLPETTSLEIDIEAIKKDMQNNLGTSKTGERNDLKAMELRKAAAESSIKIAKSNYYPSLSLTGGYIAFDLNNVLTVTNAMNVGVGVSYDLSNIFKNGKQVKFAESKAKETEIQMALLSDQIKEEAFLANENYSLSVKQSSVYEKAVEQAAENYRIVKDKYDNNLADTNDLLEADNQQLQAKINQALSKADIAQKYYELQFANGKLINSLNITQN
jgi:outer membrane protein TolC